ncbi:MAG: 3-phosphoshikimate 1-carboxyvinyltransferase [Candidatus Omnitrophica bacterium 4484_213]|nr:MAG: 3-phosphoshikimate 1-carboxyvinyltransferase [Candidatus Omnitrophica bacterium 4484_213]
MKRIKGEIFLPGDKSISHRAVMLSSIAGGTTEIENFLFCEDCLATVNAFRQMGIKIIAKRRAPRTASLRGRQSAERKIIVYGRGLRGLTSPSQPLYLGNSGTSMRLLAGILSGQNFSAKLEGDSSLSKRPMQRIIIPLKLMGADIKGKNGYPPLTIKGKKELKAIRYKIPVASAQVKSAILLAGLYAEGETELTEIAKTRDHSERMLKLFGADIKTKGLKCRIKPSPLSSPGKIKIPGDISSAAFFIIGATILTGSHLVLKNVGLNPTRTGIIDVLKRMGGKIQATRYPERQAYGAGTPHATRQNNFEPVGDIIVQASQLKGIEIKGKIIPRLIDEIPVLMVAACFAKGETRIKDIGELRKKEVDRIYSLCYNLKRMGAKIKEKKKEVAIKGVQRLKGKRLNSFGDHRTAMALAIAGLKAEGRTIIENSDCIKTSFPDFRKKLNELTRIANK